ncbi:MAG: helix-turn-helix domain-containing protein [Desulfomonilaceae bacterium]
MARKAQKSQSVGEKIREMREKLKLDIDKLAEKTGYDIEFLKEVEAGKISPAVGALIQLSRAMAVDSSELLADEKKEARRKSHLKRTKAYSYKSLTPDAEDKHLWAYLVTLDPKKEHEMVAYKHEGEEFMFVIDGKVEVKVGDDIHVIKKGEHVHFNSGIQHHLRNLSSKVSTLIVVVYTP